MINIYLLYWSAVAMKNTEHVPASKKKTNEINNNKVVATGFVGT